MSYLVGAEVSVVLLQFDAMDQSTVTGHCHCRAAVLSATPFFSNFFSCNFIFYDFILITSGRRIMAIRITSHFFLDPTFLFLLPSSCQASNVQVYQSLRWGPRLTTPGEVLQNLNTSHPTTQDKEKRLYNASAI